MGCRQLYYTSFGCRGRKSLRTTSSKPTAKVIMSLEESMGKEGVFELDCSRQEMCSTSLRRAGHSPLTRVLALKYDDFHRFTSPLGGTCAPQASRGSRAQRQGCGQCWVCARSCGPARSTPRFSLSCALPPRAVRVTAMKR
jgi:hypothetical protein